MTRHYPALGSASDCSRRVGNLIQPIRSTTHIWLVTRHQCGISALVSQTSFGGKTSVNVAKCRLFSQASLDLTAGTLRPDLQRRQRERPKSNRFMILFSQKKHLCACSTLSYISLPSLHDHDVKISNSTFYGGRKQATKMVAWFTIITWPLAIEHSTDEDVAITLKIFLFQNLFCSDFVISFDKVMFPIGAGKQSFR